MSIIVRPFSTAFRPWG